MNDKCIIIGNASNILSSPKTLGKRINKFENVIRFNRFSHALSIMNVPKLVRRLGTKCTHWVIGWNLATDNMAINNGYFSENLEKIKKTHPELKQILILSSTKTKKSKPEDALNKLKELVVERIGSSVEVAYREYNASGAPKKPTTGFLAVKYYLEYFPKVTIAGFDFGKSVHYWGNESIADIPGSHSWDKEKEYIDKLVKLDKVELL